MERMGCEKLRIEIDCVQSDVRAFGIAGDWKAMTFVGGRGVARDGQGQGAEKRDVSRLEKLLSCVQ